MDPYLLIIKYLFKRQGIENNDDSIDSFFENGLSFPQFISLIFNVDEIPKINKNPKTLFHKKMNNDLALQFLCQKNPNIGKFNPTYNNERDRTNLLLMIFTKQCFDLNATEIISKCNLIVESLNIKFEKKSDVVSLNCLLSLLNVLTNGKVSYEANIDTNKNFDEIVNQSFLLAEAPLVINKSCLDIQNHNLFLIQIEILFEFFSGKIKQIENTKGKNKNEQDIIKKSILEQHPVKKSPDPQPTQDIKNQQPINKVPNQEIKYELNPTENDNQSEIDQIKTNPDDQEEEEEEEETIEDLESNDQNISIPIKEDDWDKIDFKTKKKKKRRHSSDSDSDSSSDFGDIDLEEEQENALLKTLNVIGKGKFHFNNFHDSIINDSIPRFVMNFFNLKSIKNVNLTPIKNSGKDQKLTKEQVDNINSVIEFLSTKEITFKILKFNFQDSTTLESSAVLFYSNFLNFFFIKTLRSEMYERLAIIFCTKKELNSFDSHKELPYERILAALLYYYSKKRLNFRYNDLPSKFNSIEKKFKEVQIPMILSEKILDNGFYGYNRDSIYYQYQLIYDAIDSGPKCLTIVEILLKVIYHLKKIEVPKYNEIAESILAKRTSIEFQNARSDQYLKRTDSKNLSESLSSFENIPIEPIKKPISVETYRSRQASISSNKSNQIVNIDNKESLTNEKYENFWNSTEPIFLYDNGIMHYKETKSQYAQKWIDEIHKVQLKVAENKREERNNESSKLPKFCSFKDSQSSLNSKLYKIFIYDETNNYWKFQSDVFQQFAVDKRINVDDAETPIVFILNSDKNDSISLASNLINGVHPKLVKEQDIFIYSLCDKSLALLDYYVDFESKWKSSIKPIFLLLHIPKSKEKLPNLEKIIFEIYSFLTIISDIEVVVLNKNYYEDQFSLMRNIKEIINSFKSKFQEKKSSRSVLFSSSSSDDKDEEESENDEIEEDIWDDQNDDKDIKNDIGESLPKVFIKSAEIIFLINDSSVESSLDMEENFVEIEFFQDQLSEIDKEFKSIIHFINVKRPDSYEAFLYSLVGELKYESTVFSEVKANFNAISLSKMNLGYVHIRNHLPDWKKYLKEMITKLKKEMEIKSSGTENQYILVSKISNEVAKITPLIDINFRGECNSILSDLNSTGSKQNRELYLKELQKSADSHLLFLTDKINEKYFWTEEQMDLLTKTHFSFLKDEFYDIIQLTISEKIYNIIYEENFDIVEIQMKKSKEKLNEIFKPYIEKIKIKKNPQEQNLQEKIKKGANYCMKETENLREIKVTVQIKKDLRSEIEQDF